MKEIYITFGSEGVLYLNTPFKDLTDYQKEAIKQSTYLYRFKTKAEINAFLMGVNEANGWNNSQVISKRKYNTINNYVPIP